MFKVGLTISEDWVIKRQQSLAQRFRLSDISDETLEEVQTFCSKLVTISEFSFCHGGVDLSDFCLELIDFWRLTVLRLRHFRNSWQLYPTTPLPVPVLRRWFSSIYPSQPDRLSSNFLQGLRESKDVDPVLLFSLMELEEVSPPNLESQDGRSMRTELNSMTSFFIAHAEEIRRESFPVSITEINHEIEWQFKLPEFVYGAYPMNFRIRESSLDRQNIYKITELWLREWGMSNAA